MENKDGEQTQTFYFKTEIIEEQDILDHIILCIETEGKTIYEGPLNSRKLQDYINLCSLERGENQEVRFSLAVPKELDNKYTLNDCKVKWLFKTESVPEKVVSVKTGDVLFKLVLPWSAVIAATTLSVVLCVKKKRGNRC